MNPFKKKEINKSPPIIEADFDAVKTELERMKDKLLHTKCPACSQTGVLRMLQYDQNPSGWRVVIDCKNCNFKGELKHDAFSFLDIREDAGKAISSPTEKKK